MNIKNTKIIYRNMLVPYGEHCTTKKRVYQWADKFKRGRETPDDEE
jgi:hypothetical protein